MTRVCTLTALMLFTLLAGASFGVEETPSKPNVLLILIDDLGWMDLHCQGNARLDTPHVDRLARQGMRFTDAYAASPVCSPTRASIVTGLAPARLQLTTHISNRKFIPEGAALAPAETLDHLPLEQTTIAERLRDAGYATAFFGKWHLAGVPGRDGEGLTKFYPEHQGFGINLGGCAHGGPPSFFAPYRIHNLPDGPEGEYLPDRLAAETIKFIRGSRDKPFFVALWNYTVHWPMQAPAALVAKYAKRLGPGIKDARYAGMIEAMDGAMGRIFAALDDGGIAEETLVIFTSDNGAFLGVGDIRPLRLGKGYLYEGGIRVPLIVRWPGRVSADALCKTPVVSADLYPTILAATGLEPNKELDGVNLVPLLTGRKVLESRSLYFHYPNYAWHKQNRLGSAVREGKYKLIERFDDDSLELYDLEADLGEQTNLAGKLPDVAARLHGKLRHWRAETGAALPTRR